MSSHVIGIDIDISSASAVIFNILCLEVAYDYEAVLLVFALYL